MDKQQLAPILADAESLTAKLRKLLDADAPAVKPAAPAALPAAMHSLGHEAQLAFGGHKWEAQNAGKPHSFQAADPLGSLFRFEIRPPREGAPWDMKASKPKERSELMCKTRIFNQLCTAEFEFMMEPGPITQREWLDVWQVHQSDPQNSDKGTIANQSLGVSAPLNINIVSRNGVEYLRVRGDTTMVAPITKFARQRFFADNIPFVRGVWHKVKVVWRENDGIDTAPFAPGTEWEGHYGRDGNFGVGTGLLQVTYDDKVIVDKTNIPLGYLATSKANGGKGSYTKVGLYGGNGNAQDGPVVCWHRNVRFSVAA